MGSAEEGGMNPLQARYPHLNLRWSMAQMDRIQELARKGVAADDIAFEMDTSTVEIIRLADRNGFFVRRARGVPGLTRVTIQRGDEG
jgi:hypothetical protein